MHRFFHRSESGHNLLFEFKPLIYDPNFSESARNPIYLKAYKLHMDLYGMPVSYSYADGVLKPNHELKTQIPNVNKPQNQTASGKYIYVIKYTNQPELRIGQGSHYFLTNGPVEAQKGDVSLLAAGQITFDIETKKILEIDDFSGGFHIPEKRSDEENKNYGLSILLALDAVGLPLDKFSPANREKYPQGDYAQIVKDYKKAHLVDITILEQSFAAMKLK